MYFFATFLNMHLTYLRMLLLTLALLSVVAAGAAGAAGAVRKCCGPQQNLNANFDCVNSTVEHNDTMWWFPPPDQILAADANVSRTYLEEHHSTLMYGSPSCRPDDQLYLMKFDNYEIEQFSLVASASDILLRISEEYAPEDHLRPPADYCVDAIVVPGLASYFFGAKVCPCAAAPCVRKCCGPRMALNASLHCVPHNSRDWEPSREKVVTKQKHVLLIGKIPKCDVPHIILFGNSSMFHLNEDSHMVQRTMDRELVRQGLRPQQFCGDLVVGAAPQEVLLVCLRPEVGALERVQGALLLLGGTLLAAAAAVQTLCVLPARVRRRVHARLALCHNASLAVGFLTLGGHKLHPGVESLVGCRVLAYVIQMSFLAAFFWLNVMCIDISWAFSGLRPPQGSAAERDRKKFFMYSAYAWGGTVAIAAVTLIVEYSPSVSPTSRLKPNIGETKCWFKDNMSILLYFYGPMAVLLLGNLALFSYTACRIVAVRRETVILNMSDSRRHEGNTATSYKRDRQRLALYGKLFTLMGLTWVTEILSFAVGGPKYYWYLTDCVNILRAVYIFYIFCCKRSVLKLIRTRLPPCCPCALRPAGGGPLGGSSGQQTASIRLSDKRKGSGKSSRSQGEHETTA